MAPASLRPTEDIGPFPLLHCYHFLLHADSQRGQLERSVTRQSKAARLSSFVDVGTAPFPLTLSQLHHMISYVDIDREVERERESVTNGIGAVLPALG